LHGYLQLPVFKAELRARQDAALAGVTSALAGLSGRAVELLQDIIADKSASDNVRVRAASFWLRHTRDALELADLTQRVQKLEEQAGGAE